MDRGDSRSSSSGSSHYSSQSASEISHKKLYKEKNLVDKEKQAFLQSGKVEFLQGETYPYIQFTRDPSTVQSHVENEYSYPVMDPLKNTKDNNKDMLQTPLPLLPKRSNGKPKSSGMRNERGVRVRCRHCHDFFSESQNERGVCEFAPDLVKSTIDRVTCISCAHCMLYHCMADTEGEFDSHPCSCSGSEEVHTEEGCGRRWLGLALLSLILPCLWCYLPLRGCHQLGVRCGICGGRHEPA